MNKSKMATDLLSAGIRSFEQDGESLKEMIRKRVTELYPNKNLWEQYIDAILIYAYVLFKHSFKLV